MSNSGEMTDQFLLNRPFYSGSDHKSLVTYAGDTALFSSIQKNLSDAMVSNTIEWRRSFGRPLKLVKLDVSFMPFSQDIISCNNELSLINHPILHMYWSDCSDLEVYKSSIKEDIDNWLKSLQQHDISDWMIILVESYDTRKGSKLIPRTTVLDKVRNDFGSKHGDRCISVINPVKSESRSAESWCGLIFRIRHLMLTAYDKLLLHFGEIIREQRERRNELNWDFSRYFLMQEELAFLLEMLGIYDEALVQYDELDALFTQFVLNSDVGETPSWLRTFQDPLNSWNGFKLNKYVNFHLRKLISDCEASLLDLRSYLFGRQCTMLLLLNRTWEIAQRCLPFIYNTLSEFRILEIQKPKGSVECWAILCAIEVLDVCQIELSNADNSEQLDLCSLHTAGLWALASDKLGQLGELCGLMPENEPTSEQLHVVVYLIAGMGDSNEEYPNKVSPTDKLKSALSSKKVFIQQYLEYAELAMGTFKHIGRIRSARFIGKKLAKFYDYINENQTAITFLSDALKMYIDEGWNQLAAQTQLELANCYKKVGDIEKYIKVCNILSSTEVLELDVRNMYLEEMLSNVKNLPISEPLIVEFENSLTVIGINVNVEDKIDEECIPNIRIDLKSSFPKSIDPIYLIICTEKIIEKDKRKERSTSTLTTNSLQKWSLENIKSPDLKSSHLSIYSYCDLKEDKSLKTAGIINKKINKTEQCLIGFPKYKQNPPNGKEILTDTFKTGTLTLQPDLNEFQVTKKVSQPGIYKVTQVSLFVSHRLQYRLDINESPLYYEVSKTQPTISLNSRDLFAGLIQEAELVIVNGSITIPNNTKLNLRTSRGLKIKLIDNSTSMSNELDVTLPECEPFHVEKVKLKLFAELPLKKDSSSIEFKLDVQSPWSIEQNISLHFGPPLKSCLTLHTIKERKFLQVTVTGLTKNHLQLIDPELISNNSSDIHLKSFNPVAYQKCIIGNSIKNSYLWEFQYNQNYKFMSPLKLNFLVKYFSIPNEENIEEYDQNDDPLHISNLSKIEKSSFTYQCNFEVNDYRTIFVVTSKVEANGTGGEFCRAGSMCYLHITVMRLIRNTNLNPPPQLMYEVLADQSMWAVCGRTAGIFVLDASDRQSVRLDVMPLTSGYLPHPVVRLSRYIPATEIKNESYRNTDATGPRLEPFCPGQIYNASKSQQVHVLPAALSEFN